MPLRPTSVVYFGAPRLGGVCDKLPEWRNRQTRTTQNRVPFGNEGSIPSFGTRTARNYTLMGRTSKTSSHAEDVFIMYRLCIMSLPNPVDFHVLDIYNEKMKALGASLNTTWRILGPRNGVPSFGGAMKLKLIFVLMELTILLTYPFVFLAGKLRQILKIKR